MLNLIGKPNFLMLRLIYETFGLSVYLKIAVTVLEQIPENVKTYVENFATRRYETEIVKLT